MSDPIIQADNIRSYKQAIEKKFEKRKLTPAEVEWLQTLPEEEIQRIPWAAELLEGLSTTQAELELTKQSGWVNSIVNRQYGGHVKAVGRAVQATSIMADEEVSEAVVAGAGMDGAYKIFHPKREFSPLEVFLVALAVIIGMLTYLQVASLLLGVLLLLLTGIMFMFVRRRRTRLNG